MAASPKQVNGNTLNNNSALGKRKKSSNKCSYLSKWLDKTMHHIQEATPSMDTYDSFGPNLNWPMSNTHAPPPGFDPYRFMYAQEPMSLPTLPTYYSNIPFYNPECRYVQSVNKSVQVQRPRYRRRSEKAEEIQVTPNGTLNSTLSNANYLQPKNFTDNQDFASLPPIVTSVGDTTSNSDMNAIDKDVGSGRRYSDPCVQGLPDIARPANGDADSGSETSSDLSGSQVGSRLLSYLLDQITSLKITNERLNKELLETKAELQNVRHQHTIWQKSTANIGTPNHSPLNSNGLINGQYSPGVLTDLVREIRDAARIREEAMFSRVRSMIIERTDNGLAPAETKYTEKALEEIKSSLRATEGDRRHMMDRIIKLEDDIRSIRISNSLESNENGAMNGSTEEAEAEAERMRLHKELSDMRKAKQNAEERTVKLERLVTQLRSKFNSHQLSTNGPESLPSENEHENVRARRTSVNSSNNSTVVFGPVTDL